MLKGKGFRNVGRVEVKAETTTPGDVNRRRRSLPKLDFTILENGAFIKGPNYDCRYALRRDAKAADASEFTLNDSRATTLAVRCKNSKFYCDASLERFSGHTGICRVLGSKKLPSVPHNLKLGDLIRIGSVGLVVCEVNRGTTDDTLEHMADAELRALKAHYLSIPLSGTLNDKGCVRECSDDDINAGSSGADTSDDDEYTNEPQEPAPRICYICYDGEEDEQDNPLVAPCQCKGDTKYVHLNCLQRWNNSEDGNGSNLKVCAVTNTDGLDICSICKATYQTSVKLDNGRIVSLLAKKLPPPYITFAVVTQHETRSRATALTNTRFQLSFASLTTRNGASLTVGRSTSNNMVLRYRTVSQLHCKIRFAGGEFVISDAASSNGTMLFLSKQLELPWGKVVHIKMGRTIMAMKAKKRWKWGFVSGDEETKEENVENVNEQGALRMRPRMTARVDDDSRATDVLVQESPRTNDENSRRNS